MQARDILSFWQKHNLEFAADEGFRYGIDVMIAGETDEYAQWAARDADIPLIETSHTVSEEPGLRHAVEMLAAHFPETPVHFYELGRPWEHAFRSA